MNSGQLLAVEKAGRTHTSRSGEGLRSLWLLGSSSWVTWCSCPLDDLCQQDSNSNLKGYQKLVKAMINFISLINKPLTQILITGILFYLSIFNSTFECCCYRKMLEWPCVNYVESIEGRECFKKKKKEFVVHSLKKLNKVITSSAVVCIDSLCCGCRPHFPRSPWHWCVGKRMRK